MALSKVLVHSGANRLSESEAIRQFQEGFSGGERSCHGAPHLHADSSLIVANKLSRFPFRLGGKNSKDRVKRFCLNRSLMNMKNIAQLFCGKMSLSTAFVNHLFLAKLEIAFQV
jgi:hypothetical protein